MLHGHTHSILALAFSPDGRLLASVSKDNTELLWDVASGKVAHQLVGHGQPVQWVAFSPEGSRVGTAPLDGTARIWSASTGRSEAVLAGGHAEGVRCVAWSPDGRTIVTGGLDKTIALWNPDGALPGDGRRDPLGQLRSQGFPKTTHHPGKP